MKKQGLTRSPKTGFAPAAPALRLTARPECAERPALAIHKHHAAGSDGWSDDRCAPRPNPPNNPPAVLVEPMQITLEVADHHIIISGGGRGQPPPGQFRLFPEDAAAAAVASTHLVAYKTQVTIHPGDADSGKFPPQRRFQPLRALTERTQINAATHRTGRIDGPVVAAMVANQSLPAQMQGHPGVAMPTLT